MADGVARSPSRLCSRDEKICCYGDALSTIFLLAFVPCFPLFVFRFSFLHFGIFFVYLRLCSSHLLLSGSTPQYVFCILQYVFFLLVSLPGILFFIRLVFFSCSSYFSGGVSFCGALVPGTLALDLPTLNLSRLVSNSSYLSALRMVFLGLTVTTEFVSLQDESGRTLGVLLMMSGRKIGLM